MTRKSCKGCIYRKTFGTGESYCDYICMEKIPRNSPAEHCTRKKTLQNKKYKEDA